MNERQKAYRAIDTERDYQDDKWPAGSQTIGEFILLLEQLSCEARNQWRGQPKPETEALNTVRKIAASAVRCMELHGAPLREQS